MRTPRQEIIYFSRAVIVLLLSWKVQVCTKILTGLPRAWNRLSDPLGNISGMLRISTGKNFTALFQRGQSLTAYCLRTRRSEESRARVDIFHVNVCKRESNVSYPLWSPGYVRVETQRICRRPRKLSSVGTLGTIILFVKITRIKF